MNTYFKLRRSKLFTFIGLLLLIPLLGGLMLYFTGRPFAKLYQRYRKSPLFWAVTIWGIAFILWFGKRSFDLSPSHILLQINYTIYVKLLEAGMRIKAASLVSMYLTASLPLSIFFGYVAFPFLAGL